MMGMVAYRSKINGVEFDVPEDDITVDFLNTPEKLQFIEPLDTPQLADTGKTAAGVPKAKGKTAKAGVEAKVEME
ncbi:hypothetical protein [Neisseria animalis]|uniref:Uncharacterized protein n=1 Tax=Neisseria animalis TaxID=492 RepID=A0A5P3MT49_NEIAN|nr:hypothetical protein [Neisseria animalis]QEY24787.1 hypothetical protein D0T90_10175 [Neisseria animalis]ROW31542.1 hypothetical protein CGZ60_09820 [Neisseria animalis]VEE07711.1 Uncharacterised protein [Neisseria animalis]